MSNPDHNQRVMPHSVEAEQGLLGSMLIAPQEVVDDCAQLISAEAFYEPRHQTVFALLIELWDKQHPADLITLTQALRERKQLDAVGGAAYITSLIDFTPTAANARYYLDIVREKYTLRRIIATCTDCAARAYDDNGEVNILLDDVERNVLAINEDRSQVQNDDPRVGTLAAVEVLEAIFDGKQEVVGIKLGLPPLDRMLGGAAPGQMIVIAARPSVGKSALALNFAESLAVDRLLPVGLFSMEMTQQEQRHRLILSRAEVDSALLRDRLVPEDGFARIRRAVNKIAEAPFYIDDKRGLTITELRARTRRWHQRHGLQLLIVDYLQLLKSTSRQAQNSREREVSEISEGLKSLAGELRIPVIALSQLNRDMDKTKRKPRLSDLRESGSLEQDADVVLLLHREEMQAENEEQQAELAGEAELIVAKQRRGPTGPIKLTFRKEFCRFNERAEERPLRVSDLHG